MNNSYQAEPNHSDENVLSQLTIAVDKDGEFIFGCDWDDGEAGIEAVASIFFSVSYDDLMEKILGHLKAQCVLEGNEDFDTILETIKKLISLNSKDDDSGDSVVVPPRNVLKL